MKKGVVLGLLLCFLGSATVHAQSPFFQGKTINLIVGYQPGDGYDIWARLLAAHLG
jgi:tripartite-type tricarboxylate transporter receptor subunit TctC